MINKDARWVERDKQQGVKAAEGIVRTVLAYCDECMCVENAFQKGSVGAIHSHPHTQLTYIAAGIFEFTIGDEVKIVHAGDTLLKRNGVEHGCVCMEEGVLIDFFTPMREDFI